MNKILLLNMYFSTDRCSSRNLIRIYNMSVLHTSENGWIISHEKYIKNIYQNVYKSTAQNYQLKQVLFNIKSPFVRNNQNVIENNEKDSKHNLKRKRKKISTNSNFEELKNEVYYVDKTYNTLSEELDCSSVFNNNCSLNNENNVQNNKQAQNEAEKCYNETDKYSIINSHGSNGDQALVQTVNGASFLFPKLCKFYCKNITEMSETFTNELFDLILLDPPWWNKYIRRKNAKSNQGYQMMYNLDLSVIPINKILSNEGLVIVWCTNSPQHLKDLQEEIFPKWGIRFVAKWYWLKVTNEGVPVCAFSEPPCKQPFEQIVFGTRINNPKNSVPHGKIVVSVPSALHSHKPPLADLLSAYIKENPQCLEIFARYLLPGWTSWGLEVLKLQHECLYEIQN